MKIIRRLKDKCGKPLDTAATSAIILIVIKGLRGLTALKSTVFDRIISRAAGRELADKRLALSKTGR
jgi:hypothetical protein